MDAAARWRCTALVTILAFGACRVQAQPAAWHAAVPLGVSTHDAEILQSLAQGLERHGSGVRLTVDPATEPAARVLRDVQSASAQVTLIPIGLLSPQAPDFAVFDGLFVFRDLQAVDRYTNSVEGRRLLDSLTERGLRGLGFVHVGMVQVATRQPPASPADWRGRKIMATGGDAAARQFAALGATTLRVPAAEVTVTLQQGLADSAEYGWRELSGIRDSGLTVVETNHRYRGYVLAASEQAFSRLPRPAQDQLLVEAERVVDAHNADAIAEESRERAQALSGGMHSATLARKDYDAVYLRLKEGGWSVEDARRKTLASAVAVSDLDLARSHFGSAAPAAAPARAARRTPPAAADGGSPRTSLGPPAAGAAGGGLFGGIGSFVSGLGNLFADTSAVGSVTMSSTAPPVYNADLDPQLPRDAATPSRPKLKAGGETTLRFDIGPKWATSVLASGTVAAPIASSKEDVPLTVILACDFCEPHSDWVKHTTFRPRAGRADEIRFQFVPRKRGDGQGYTAKLQIAIVDDRTGRDYDRIVLPLSVGEGDSPVAAANRTALVVPQSTGAAGNLPLDVVLHATEEMGRNVTISIEPISDVLKQRLGPLTLGVDGRPRVFRSGIDDPDLVDAMTNSAFGAMSAVSMQSPALLKKLSATGDGAVVSKASQDSLRLTDDESANVAAVIGETGQSLYRRLFVASSDTGLLKAIRELEAAADASDRPLRMRVVTNRLSLPWQYIHPTGPKIEMSKFWGMRFSLTVTRVNSSEGLPSTATGARKVVFARYGSSADSTVALAEDQAKLLAQKVPLTDQELLKVDNGPDLLKRVSDERKQIFGIVTFLHASSTDAQPQLQFNTNDVVTSDKLAGLMDKMDADLLQRERYLTAGPLVILNACETGPSRNLPYVKLQNSLFELGARGVLVTEVSVWVSLGDEVARRMLDRLVKGEPAGDALTAVRRELVAERKNPLGLLYVYYGDPTASLKR